MCLIGADAEKVAQDETLSNKLAILISIPGIAETTAFSMLIEMPELGTLEGKQAASLAGLAPMSRQSGKWQGKERIRPGFLSCLMSGSHAGAAARHPNMPGSGGGRIGSVLVTMDRR